MNEVTQEMIQTLLALNDTELQKKFAEIAAILGMGERAASNTAKFRSLLESTGADDLNRLLASLGRDRAGQVLRAMDGEKP